MSNVLTRAARPLVMPPTCKAVLMALADMARDPDAVEAPAQAWPPMHGQDGTVGLCDWTCLSERTVQRAVKELVAAGHVTRRQLRRGTLYTVHPGAPLTPVTVTPDRPTPDTVALTPGAVTGKASISTSREKKTASSLSTRGRSAAVTVPHDLPAGTDPDAWRAFVEMRHEMARGGKPRRPWTAGAAVAAVRTLTRLATAGDDPTTVLERSTLNGWQGLFPLDRRDRDDMPTVAAAQRAMALLTPDNH